LTAIQRLGRNQKKRIKSIFNSFHHLFYLDLFLKKLFFIISKAFAMPSALTSWLWPCQTGKFLFSFFYLFEIKFYFQVWQGPQQGCQHQRLNCRPAKLETLQKKIPKQ
jgi:hypothetical protein